MKRILVVSGRSGSGKSSALHVLEDMGFYCIDNLPLSLLPDIVARMDRENHLESLALGVDVRTPQSDLLAFGEILQQLSVHGSTEVLYLDARDDILLGRFAATRRRHPLSDRHPLLLDALQAEHALLAEVRDHASQQLDTSQFNIHDLQHTLSKRMGQGERMIVVLESFGFKYGLPQDADCMFDARILPNPHWQPELRRHSGLDAQVQAYFDQHAVVQEFLQSIEKFLQQWLAHYAQSHRHYLTVAIGCTGGKHRSVYLVDRLSRALAAQWPVQTLHREMKHWS